MKLFQWIRYCKQHETIGESVQIEHEEEEEVIDLPGNDVNKSKRKRNKGRKNKISAKNSVFLETSAI